MTGQTDPLLEARWKRVIDDWDNDAEHQAFLEYCRSSEQLVEAAVRYRGMSGDRTRAAKAERNLKAVALLAMTALESSRSPERGARTSRFAYVLLAFFLVATVGLLAYLGATR